MPRANASRRAGEALIRPRAPNATTICGRGATGIGALGAAGGATTGAVTSAACGTAANRASASWSERIRASAVPTGTLVPTSISICSTRPVSKISISIAPSESPPQRRYRHASGDLLA